MLNTVRCPHFQKLGKLGRLPMKNGCGVDTRIKRSKQLVTIDIGLLIEAPSKWKQPQMGRQRGYDRCCGRAGESPGEMPGNSRRGHTTQMCVLRDFLRGAALESGESVHGTCTAHTALSG